MISVIIPVYNAEPYLSRCLDSVLGSTYSDFELLLINDGSTDRSPEICAEYARRDSRVRLFSQENQGVSAARNCGLQECAGEWVVFVDADDAVSPDFLGLIAAEDDPAQDMLLFDFTYVEGAFSAPNRPPLIACCSEMNASPFLRNVLVQNQLVQGGHVNFGTPWAKAYRKAVLDQYSIRFSPELPFGEDVFFNIEYHLKIKKCKYICASVYFYYIHDNSLSHGFPEIGNLTAFLVKIKTALETCHLFSELEADYYSCVLDHLGHALVWTVFNPGNAIPYAEKRRLCREMRDHVVYRQALKRNWSCGILPRRVLLFSFYMKWYRIVYVLCRLSYLYLKWKFTQ